MTYKAKMITALAALALSGQLSAAGPNYNFVEGRYLIDTDIDERNLDGDGFHLGGSYRFTGEIYAFGNLRFNDYDHGVDATVLNLGGGYILPIHSNWDSNFTFGMARWDVDGIDDEIGFELSGGVRGMLTPEIEARAKLTYLDIDDLGDDAYLTLGGDYFFMPNLSAGLELDVGGDFDSLSAGVRYFFK
jgi:hypothetical protein